MNRLERGFTLIEVIVVVAIISILSTVTYTMFTEAREKSRDKVRKNDLEQIELALRLYVEKTGSYIDCNGGLRFDGQTNYSYGRDVLSGGESCVDGQNIFDFINKTFGAVPHDPRGPNNDDYFYYFDNAHWCGSFGVESIIFAVNLESEDTNAPAVCEQLGASNNQGGYSFTSADFIGGTFNPSVPYVKNLSFTRRVP